MANKLGSLIVNGGVNSRAMQQLVVRGKALAKQRASKINQDLLFANSRTPWIKISSAANIAGSSDLARNNILSNGTALTGIYFGGKYQVNRGTISDRGIVPKPGVESLQISYKGSYGVLKEFKFDFKCYDMAQLELYEKLYMKPGISLLIEYGHSVYLNNSGDYITDIETVSGFFDEGISQKDIQAKCSDLTVNSDYNYNGEIGLVKNFSYAFDQDSGGYKCSVNVMSKNSIFEGVVTTGSPSASKVKPSALFLRANQVINKPPESNPEVDTNGKKEEGSLGVLSPVLDILDILLTHSGTRKDPVAEVNKKYTNFDYPSALKPFFLYKVSDKKGTKKMSYIKLAAFLKILDNALFPTGNKGEKLVSFAYDLKEDRFNYATFENHFSLDPNIILPKAPKNKYLWLGAGDKNDSMNQGSNNILDIFLSLQFLIDLTNQYVKPENKKLVDLIDDLCSKINIAIGGYNRITYHYSTEADEYHLLDLTETGGDNLASSVITVSGPESVARSIDVASSITNDLMKIITISAQADPSAAADYGMELGRYLGDVTDRTKKKVEDANGATTTKEEKDDITKMEEAVTQFSVYRKIDGDQLDLYAAHKTYTLGGFGKSTLDTKGIMPYSLSLEIDGHSGIAPMQNFRISDGIIPPSTNDIVAFRVTSVDNDVSENGWVTKIGTKMFFDRSLLVEEVGTPVTYSDKPLETKLQDIIDEKNNKDA